MSTLGPLNERLIERVVTDISPAEIQKRIRLNAAGLGVLPTNEIADVATTLIKHYQNHPEDDHCQDVHRNMRFLEQAYTSKGGGKYLLELFPQGQGVIHTIHALLNLPDLNLDIDPGIGTAF